MSSGVTPYNQSDVMYDVVQRLLDEQSVADTLTAHAGGGQASALQLTKSTNRVTTVGSAADSVALPAAVGSNQSVYVRNDGANSMQVFGNNAAQDTINGVASGTGVAVGAAKGALFISHAAGKWTMLLSA